MRKAACFLLTALLLVSSVSAANAMLETQMLSFTDITHTPNQTFHQTFNLFDLNAGTLNSVSVSMHFTDVGSLAVVNNGSMDNGFTDAQLYEDITAKVSSWNHPFYRVESSKVSGPLLAYSTSQFDNLAGTGPISSQSVSSNKWNLFATSGGGNGTFDVSAVRLTGGMFDDYENPVYFSSLSGITNGTITLTYDFTPNAVPIPAAVWLLGSGIVGLAALRRKVQK